MPHIIVQPHPADGTPGAPTFVERVVPVDLQNEHYIAQLIERLAWALADAERLERPDRVGSALAPRAELRLR